MEMEGEENSKSGIEEMCAHKRQAQVFTNRELFFGSSMLERVVKTR